MERIKEFFALLQLNELLNYGFWDLLVNVVIFVLLAVPAFMCFWVIYKEKFQARRIQQKRRTSNQGLKREIRNSIVSLLIFTTIDVLVYLAQLKGYTKIYTDVNEFGWIYLVFSLGLMIILHDAIFYFVHRLMHHPLLYNTVHKVHHQSSDPSPFAAFSFHPIEAGFEILPFVLFAFLMPVHMVALWIWQIMQITLNVVGHMGYEIYPSWLNKHWLFRYKTAATHHNMHHGRVHGNYGLYFTWWDRFFGTEFSDYNKTFNDLQERVKENQHVNVPAKLSE